MGCTQSVGTSNTSNVFGATGLHVGRDGDVDLTSRSMDFLMPKYVNLIRRDKLHTARQLHLSDNNLYTLGKEMTLLTDIEELYIDNNRFERVPSVLSFMEKLRLLNASMNPLGKHTLSLEVLPHIKNLVHLTLRSCSLSVIPSCLLRCAVLKELDLSDNPNLQLAELKLSNLSALQVLRIANCGINGEIPAGVKEMTTLLTLDISSNSFNFDAPEFFGRNLPHTLTELHLRRMRLVAVPQVIVELHKLSSLDLAENALETLDVLAGRLVRKLSLFNISSAFVLNAVTEPSDDAISVSSQSSSYMSASQISRAGRIAKVDHPIPLRKLCLRACGFHTLPKYFHKLRNLVELDLSENENLQDPNMTLFSFSNLQVLNITECPFAANRSSANNEWFDISNLHRLHTLDWEVWKGTHNMSPYCTKVPLEICGLQLRYINGMKLRPNLFVGDTVQTIVNLLVDGYLKVDLALNDDLVLSYTEAVQALRPLESFFFASSKKDGAEATVTPPQPPPKHVGTKLSHAAAKNGRTTLSTTKKVNVHKDALQIAINRYIFFLTMQAANYNAVIVPPADVMAIHYAQMTQDPISYRSDCEAICGQVLSCNYNLYFLEQKLRPQTLKEALVGSKRVWNMMVRTTQKDIFWLRYDFWEIRAQKISREAAQAQNKTMHEDGGNENIFSAADTTPEPAPAAASAAAPPPQAAAAAAAEAIKLPCAPPCNGADLGNLSDIDAVGDLRSVLDSSITTHFTEKGINCFVSSLDKFFFNSKRFMEDAEFFTGLNLNWTRYVKYLALYAHIQRVKQPDMYQQRMREYESVVQNNSLVSPDAYLPKPKDGG
ncbi:lipoprotein [Trypanosoma rangeli]|uniref:Lipoprotein n=1 Tax=Trypanosoma rangeli TaxID=5698 RepID=A0A422NZ80_TRYRA|nr:lipoprotein [Trypanosoma rangeli]RNF10803.1 lipoprotein [Trypanosoma rangeli]|eukprot:RNF10803.1 lipoprotein [Trypanosoma rangeli]